MRKETYHLVSAFLSEIIIIYLSIFKSFTLINLPFERRKKFSKLYVFN